MALHMDDFRITQTAYGHGHQDLSCYKATPDFIDHALFDWPSLNDLLAEDGSLFTLDWNDLVAEDGSLFTSGSPSIEEELMQITEQPYHNERIPEEAFDYDDMFIDNHTSGDKELCYDEMFLDFCLNQTESPSTSGDLAIQMETLLDPLSAPLPCSAILMQESVRCEGLPEDCTDGFRSDAITSSDCPSTTTSLIPCNTDSTEFKGLRLFHLLTACAEAISDCAHELAGIIISKLQKLVSPIGSTMERVAYYLSRSLQHHHRRSLDDHMEDYSPNTSKLNYLGAFSLLNQVYPFIRFAHFTANQSILEAIPAKTETVHIIDLDIMEGMQWPPLMEAFKNGRHHIGHLKITAVEWKDDEKSAPFCHCEATGRRLSDYANSLGIPFFFQSIQMDDIDGKLRGGGDEVVIVNCMWELPHMRLRSRKRIAEFVKGARELHPLILTAGSGPDGIQSSQNMSFVERFVQCLKNSCALFDCAQSGVAEQHGLARATVENLFLGPMMCRSLNFLPEEEDDPLREIPLKCGFVGVDISDSSIMNAKCTVMVLVAGNCNPQAVNYYGVESAGKHELLLSWQSTPLTWVSTWKPMTVAA